MTEYSADRLGRFQAIKSSIKTINVNPGVACRPMPRVGVRFGLKYQRIEAEFSNKVPPAAISGLDATAVVEDTDNAWGWNAGVPWELDDKTRAGAHFRPSVTYQVTGTVNFSHPAGAATQNTGIGSDVKLPAILNLS